MDPQSAHLYPAHRIKTTDELLPYVHRSVQTLTDVSRTITRTRMSDDLKQALLLDALNAAGQQLNDAQHLAAEYAMRRGLSQTRAAEALGVSHTLTGSWWHNPLAETDLFDATSQSAAEQSDD